MLLHRLAETVAFADFFELVSQLERFLGVTVGEAGAAADDRLRFRHSPSMGFSAADVARLVWQGAAENPERVEVTTTFLGLTGAATPLPLYIAEEVAQEDEADPVKRDFLDIFHHRLIGLLYRGVARYRIPDQAHANLDDRWSERLLGLAGASADDSARASRLPRRLQLRLASLVASGARSKTVVEAAVRAALEDDLPGVVLELRQFLGVWCPIPEGERMRLGEANNALGHSSLLGGAVFDAAGKVQLVLRQLEGASYERLLPGGDLHERVSQVLDLFSPGPLRFELELVVADADAPRFRLATSSGSKLGRGTWLRTHARGETRHVVPTGDVRAAAAPPG